MLQPRADRLAARSRGAAVIEYVLLLALFTLIAIPGIARLRQGTEDEVRDTSADIGGTPVGTTPPPVTRDTLPPTTTAAPNALSIDAGPDFTVTPGVAHVQDGSVSSPNYPVTQTYWQITTSAGRVGTTFTELGVVGGMENFTTSVRGTWTRPGSYAIRLYAKNQFSTQYDQATVKVTSGHVTPSISVTGNWTSSTKWQAVGKITLVNQYGYFVPSTTVTMRWTLSNGTGKNVTCTTNTSGTCSNSYTNLADTITSATVSLVSLSGPCLDTYDQTPISATITQSGFGPWVPPTTTTTTTGAPTTTVKATTTTKPPTTTTSPPATTTTRSTGPNG